MENDYPRPPGYFDRIRPWSPARHASASLWKRRQTAPRPVVA